MTDVMKDAAPLLIALLLITSLPAMALVAADSTDEAESQSSMVEAEETPNRLALDGEVRTEYVDSATDLGAVLSTTDDALRSDRELYALESELENASDDEQADVLERTEDRLLDRLATLEDREETAVTEHAAGNSSNAELLHVLIANQAEAERLSDAFDELEAQATAVPGYTVSTRAERHQIGLYTEAVPNRIADDARGESAANDGTGPIRIETSETGYSIAMVDQSVMYSETTRFDNRNISEESQFDGDHSAAYRHANDEEFYPWVMSRSSGHASVGFQATQLYHITAPHTQGELEIVIDGATGDVYKEFHQLTLADLPTESVDQTWAENGLELSINETPANGPAKVTVTDELTGEPVDATVAIDDHNVGETDADGTLWVLPTGDSYEVDVDARGATVNATVERTADS